MSGVSRLVAMRRPGIAPAYDARVPSQFVRCPGDGAPRKGRGSLVLSPVVTRVACLLRCTLEFPLDSCGARLSSSPPPPPPFLLQQYFSQYPPDQRESIFVVIPLALSPLVTPGLGPVNILTAVMAPFLVHPPPSYAILVGHSRLALNRHIVVVLRSVTTLRHGRGHGPRLPWLLTTGPKKRT